MFNLSPQKIDQYNREENKIGTKQNRHDNRTAEQKTHTEQTSKQKKKRTDTQAPVHVLETHGVITNVTSLGITQPRGFVIRSVRFTNVCSMSSEYVTTLYQQRHDGVVVVVHHE